MERGGSRPEMVIVYLAGSVLVSLAVIIYVTLKASGHI